MTGKCQHCGKAFGPLPSTAPHKRFCGARCRQQFHAQRRASASALLDALQPEYDLDEIEDIKAILKEFRNARS